MVTTLIDADVAVQLKIVSFALSESAPGIKRCIVVSFIQGDST